MHRQHKPATDKANQHDPTEQQSSQALSPEDAVRERVQRAMDDIASLRVAGKPLAAALTPFNQAMEHLLDTCKNPERVTNELHLPTGGEIAQIPDADFALAMLTPPSGNVFEVKNPVTDELIVRYEKLSSGQGVLFTPSHTRRTTEGFALGVATEPGVPVPNTMRALRPEVFLNLFALALESPNSLKKFPYSSSNQNPVHGWSAVRQEIPISLGMEHLEVHKATAVMDSIVLAPGGLAALPGFGGLAFGYSDLPLTEPGYAIGEAFAGVSHLTLVTMLSSDFCDGQKLTKKALGFPEYSEASERERTEGMFYNNETPEELFHADQNGKPIPFKVTYLTPEGNSIITLAFNITYPGVVKKDKKAGISAAVNLRGMALEEHAGAALVRPQRILGAVTAARSLVGTDSQTFQQACLLLADEINLYREQEFALLHADPELALIPEKAIFNSEDGIVSWTSRKGERIDIQIHDDSRFMLPNGDLISARTRDEMLQLIHTDAEGVLIRRNNTASAGGKTETASSLITEEFLLPIEDLDAALDRVEQVLSLQIKRKDGTFLPPLDPALPAEELETKLEELAFQIEFSQIVDDESIALVMALKFLLPPGAIDEDWQSLLSTREDADGDNILYFAQMPLTTTFALLGETQAGEEITAPLKHSIALALRTQTEDDISLTVIQPASSIRGLGGKFRHRSIVERSDDVEKNHFNRPDEVLRGPGVAPEVETRLAGQVLGPDQELRSNMLVNWKLQTAANARLEVATGRTSQYSPALQAVVENVARGPDNGTYISPAAVVDENIRLMEPTPNVESPSVFAVAKVSRMLSRQVKGNAPLITHAHMTGEKNTILSETGPTLAFQGPLYLETGIRRAISGLTGKSPSITSEGAEPGIEGPLTKYPFNYLQAFADLNTYVVGRALCGHTPFTTPSGQIGTDIVGHNMGYLMTETVARMTREELEPENLLRNGYIEPLPDLHDSDGTLVKASLLGYRITDHFLREYVSRVLSNPTEYIPTRWLKPEAENKSAYIEGVKTVLRAQKRVAQQLLAEGADEYALLPVRATLHMMVNETGEYHFDENGKKVSWDQNHPDYLSLFTPESMLTSTEYRARLETQQANDLLLLDRKIEHATNISDQSALVELNAIRSEVASSEYLESLIGTFGADPIFRQAPETNS